MYFSPSVYLSAVCRHPHTESNSGRLSELHLSSPGWRRESVPDRPGESLWGSSLWPLPRLKGDIYLTHGSRPLCEYPIHTQYVFRHRAALALSGPVQSEEQEELLAHVSGGLVNRSVISPLLFRLSTVFSSKTSRLQGGADFRDPHRDTSGSKTFPKIPFRTPPPTTPTASMNLRNIIYEDRCCLVFSGVWNRIYFRFSASIHFIPNAHIWS